MVSLCGRRFVGGECLWLMVTLGTVWGGPGCPVGWPQPHSLTCLHVWDRLQRMDKRSGTKMSAEPWGDCIEPSANEDVLGRETTWSCCGLWQGQDPTSSFLLVGHPITYIEYPYYPTARTNHMLCLCEIASYLWPCTFEPQAFIQNKGCHCKSFGEEGRLISCLSPWPCSCDVLLIGSKMEKKKPWINSKILSLISLRKGRKGNMSFWKVLLLLALCPVGRGVLDDNPDRGEKGGQWAAFLGCARWEGARRHPLRHQLSWKAGERSWEQRSISLCRQGDSQPISEGIDFSHQKVFFVFLYAKKKRRKKKNKTQHPPLI